ncbi:MAG TPA: LuxR C-terminal-related transcriptional regulator [Streptosporangiaceae bacterium]|nr:LuxR C-terminal-related transcriptional regulator [Streptosporangiaceae bacterium]
MVSGPALSVAQLNAELLEDKLRVPLPGLAVLTRRRVRDLIDAAVTHRVTLVTGPPGSGKTVAAAQWAAAKPASRRPAWVSLDASDREPGRFWRYVTAALSGAGALNASKPAVAPGISGPSSGVAGPPPGIAAAEIPQWMAAVVRHAAEPVVLVLDDVHLLAGSEALAGLDELIRHEPAGLRLLLAGRSAPGLALSRLRLAGELADIGAADLACTPEETAAYFEMLGTPLSLAERDRVFRRTEGWLAGLRLTALGTEPADYLHDELLDQLSPDVRNFMLRTCLTPTVPADLARDLAGDAAAARMLEQLSRDCGLVQPVSPDSAEYRYHPVLRDVLFADLCRELPDEVPVLQGRVARWHADSGDLLAAVQAAAGAGDWEFGMQLLREAGPAVLLSPAGPALEAALTTVPARGIVTDSVLAIALAAARLWQGDADGALPHLEAAESALARAAAQDAARDGSDSTRSKPDEAGIWVAALRVLHKAAVSAAGPGWLDREWDIASQSHTDPRGAPEHRALGVLWLALGLAALREFDSHLARSALLHASSQLSAGGLMALRERGRAFEALACALYGDLAAAVRLAASVTDGPHGRDDDLRPVLALAGAAVSLARDEPDAAGTLLDQADLAAMAPRPAGEPSIAVLSGFLRARLAVAEGNLAGARGLVRWLTDAVAGAVQAGFDLSGPGQPAAGYGAAAVIAVLDAEISLAAGEPGRARATLTELVTRRPAGHARAGTAGRGEAVGPVAAVAEPEAAICEAKLLIADSDDKGAIEQVTPIITGAAGACPVTDRIAALLTAVVAHRRLNQSGEAAELLSLALALAEPEEACGPFVAAGPPVRSALTVLVSPSSRSAGFASRILDRFDGRLSRPTGSHPTALLTDSELAVLRFLPSHMTNQEIAEALFLSINTIKTHLSSVYRKLGVANRRQAIAQGRRLDLLLPSLRRNPLRPKMGAKMGSARTGPGGATTSVACSASRLPRACGQLPPPRRRRGFCFAGTGRLRRLMQAEGEAAEHQAVEHQPGRDDCQQQHERERRPDQHDDPGCAADHAKHCTQGAARCVAGDRGADVGDAMRDEEHARHERDQEQAERVVPQQVDPGEEGEQSDGDVTRPHAAAVVACSEPLEQLDDAGDQHGGTDEDRDEGQ